MPRPSTLPFLLVGCIGLALAGCVPAETRVLSFEDAFVQNPLMAQVVADQMIDFVTNLQIHANERKQPIKDPRVLRTIDETFVRARAMLKKAYAEQDAGKKGSFLSFDDVFVKGEALLFGESIFFGYDFEADAVPGMRVILAQHVGPKTSAELRSQPTMDLGPLQSIIGPQEYHVGTLSEDEWNRYRTVALYAPSLDRIIAYAQIRKHVAKEGE